MAQSNTQRFFKNFASGFTQSYNNYQPQPQIIPPQVNIQQQQPTNCITTRTMTGMYYTTCQ